MSRLLTAVLALTIGCGAALADDKTKPVDDKVKPADKATVNGTYTIVAGEENGKAIPKERIEGSLVIFTDKTVAGTDKDKKEFFSSTYTIDSSKTPWVITMTDAGRGGAKPDDKKPAEKQSTMGLIKVDGEMVTVIYALPGGKTPTEFKTADMQQMFVMKRADKK